MLLLDKSLNFLVICVCIHNTCTYTGILTVVEGDPFEYLKKRLRSKGKNPR